MAAHILTGIDQISKYLDSSDDFLWGQLDVALLFSCWTEDLEFEHYQELAHTVSLRDRERLTSWIYDVLPIYRGEWEELGRPRTREEWRSRKFQRVAED